MKSAPKLIILKKPRCLKASIKTISNSRSNIETPEPSSPPILSPGYTNTAEAQESDLKSSLTLMIEAFKEEMNEYLKNTGKYHQTGEGN